jgi:hypothetical protein
MDSQPIPADMEADLRSMIEGYLEREEIAPDEPGKFTITDVAQALGVGRSAARARVKRLWAADKIEPAMVKRVDPWGCRQTVKGYRFVNES